MGFNLLMLQLCPSEWKQCVTDSFLNNNMVYRTKGVSPVKKKMVTPGELVVSARGNSTWSHL
jgi:hypothetical protein